MMKPSYINTLHDEKKPTNEVPFNDLPLLPPANEERQCLLVLVMLQKNGFLNTNGKMALIGYCKFALTIKKTRILSSY